MQKISQNGNKLTNISLKLQLLSSFGGKPEKKEKLIGKTGGNDVIKGIVRGVNLVHHLKSVK